MAKVQLLTSAYLISQGTTGGAWLAQSNIGDSPIRREYADSPRTLLGEGKNSSSDILQQKIYQQKVPSLIVGSSSALAQEETHEGEISHLPCGNGHNMRRKTPTG